MCSKSFRTRSLASDGVTKYINSSACLERGSVKGWFLHVSLAAQLEKGSRGNCKLLYLRKLDSSYVANLALETKTRTLPSEKFWLILVHQQESHPLGMD